MEGLRFTIAPTEIPKNAPKCRKVMRIEHEHYFLRQECCKTRKTENNLCNFIKNTKIEPRISKKSDFEKMNKNYPKWICKTDQFSLIKPFREIKE